MSLPPCAVVGECRLSFLERHLRILFKAFLALAAKGPDKHSAEQGDKHERVDDVSDGIHGWPKLPFPVPRLGKGVFRAAWRAMAATIICPAARKLCAVANRRNTCHFLFYARRFNQRTLEQVAALARGVC